MSRQTKGLCARTKILVKDWRPNARAQYSLNKKEPSIDLGKPKLIPSPNENNKWYNGLGSSEHQSRFQFWIKALKPIIYAILDPPKKN